jgi:hypothetical protein
VYNLTVALCLKILSLTPPELVYQDLFLTLIIPSSPFQIPRIRSRLGSRTPNAILTVLFSQHIVRTKYAASFVGGLRTRCGSTDGLQGKRACRVRLAGLAVATSGPSVETLLPKRSADWDADADHCYGHFGDVPDNQSHSVLCKECQIELV